MSARKRWVSNNSLFKQSLSKQAHFKQQFQQQFSQKIRSGRVCITSRKRVVTSSWLGAAYGNHFQWHSSSQSMTILTVSTAGSLLLALSGQKSSRSLTQKMPITVKMGKGVEFLIFMGYHISITQKTKRRKETFLIKRKKVRANVGRRSKGISASEIHQP